MSEEEEYEYEHRLLRFSPWRQRVHEIIFGYDTFAGKAFDIGLLIVILLSVCAVMWESVESINAQYGRQFQIAEWIFTALFSIEFIARLVSSPRPMKYVFSFMGMVDILSLIPSYLGFFVAGSESLLVIRSIRLIRIFRILKLTRYIGGADTLGQALYDSRHKVIVFLGSVMTVVVIMGTLMYLIEGRENGFTSIPRSIYWAIVTLTTVGYGDIAPQTTLGQAIASMVMIMGYAIIAVPTGIVTTQMAKEYLKPETTDCPKCKAKDLEKGSNYCRHCGEEL